MKRTLISILFILISPVLMAKFSRGAEFTVNTAAQLQNALTTASANGEDDTIKVAQGTYKGNFTFDSSEGHSLFLLGAIQLALRTATLILPTQSSTETTRVGFYTSEIMKTRST